MAGVGADPGKDVCSDIAGIVGAASVANVSHGGATTDDALRLQVPAVPATSTVVVVQIGFNDERPGADGRDLYTAWQQCLLSGYTYNSYCGSAAAPGYSEPASASSIDGTTFLSSPTAIASRFSAIVTGIKARAPRAKIVLAVPPDTDRIPQYLSATNGGPNFPANSRLTANFNWILRTATCPVAGSTATVSTWTMPCSIRDAVQAQAGVTVVNLADAPASLYVSTNFSDVGSVLGHPNDAGAFAIAALLAGGIH
jgi:lysophospholipase L1-like esterase